MQFLRTNTATRITVGPFLNKTDGVTPETAITVTSCKLTMIVDDGGVPTLVLDTAPTASGGANDMVHITGDDAGYYDLELAAANVNYLGRAKLAITNAAVHCPVFMEFMILPAVVYDSFVLGTDVFQVDVTQFGGSNLTSASGIPEVKVASLAAAALTSVAAAVWDALTSGMSTVGSIGKKLADWVVGTIDTYTGNTKQTGDSYARLGAPAGASIAADIAAIPAAVGALVVHTGITLIQSLRMIGALVAGKTAGAGSGSVTFRNPIDTLDAVIVTMTGLNRTAVTKDLSA